MGDNSGYELDSNEKKTGNEKFDDEHKPADKEGKSSKLKLLCGILVAAVIAATIAVVLFLVLRNDSDEGIIGEYTWKKLSDGGFFCFLFLFVFSFFPYSKGKNIFLMKNSGVTKIINR